MQPELMARECSAREWGTRIVGRKKAQKAQKTKPDRTLVRGMIVRGIRKASLHSADNDSSDETRALAQPAIRVIRVFRGAKTGQNFPVNQRNDTNVKAKNFVPLVPFCG
jgi:hypothetical protein